MRGCTTCFCFIIPLLAWSSVHNSFSFKVSGENTAQSHSEISTCCKIQGRGHLEKEMVVTVQAQRRNFYLTIFFPFAFYI